MRYLFARLDKKYKLLGNFEKFSKIFKKFLKKISKCIILHIFQKNLTYHALLFARLDEKYKLFGNSEKILEIFDENSIEKLKFLSIFVKNCC